MSQLDIFLRERRFLPYPVQLQHSFINYDVIYIRDPRTVSDLTTLLKYICLACLLRHRDSLISDVLEYMNAETGKHWMLCVRLFSNDRLLLISFFDKISLEWLHRQLCFC